MLIKSYLAFCLFLFLFAYPLTHYCNLVYKCVFDRTKKEEECVIKMVGDGENMVTLVLFSIAL